MLVGSEAGELGCCKKGHQESLNVCHFFDRTLRWGLLVELLEVALAVPVD